MDGQGQVGAHHVGVLQGPEHREAQTEAEPDRLVDAGGVGDTVLDDGDRLPPQGVLQAVGQEPGDVAVDPHRVLAALLEHRHGRVHHCGVGVLRAHHLHQGDQEGWVPEVGSRPAGAGWWPWRRSR